MGFGRQRHHLPHIIQRQLLRLHPPTRVLKHVHVILKKVHLRLRRHLLHPLHNCSHVELHSAPCTRTFLHPAHDGPPCQTLAHLQPPSLIPTHQLLQLLQAHLFHVLLLLENDVGVAHCVFKCCKIYFRLWSCRSAHPPTAVDSCHLARFIASKSSLMIFC